MGYIIIDEEELKRRVGLWNNSSYRQDVMCDVVNSKVDYSHLLEALQQAETKIDGKIKELQEKKESVRELMKYAK